MTRTQQVVRLLLLVGLLSPGAFAQRGDGPLDPSQPKDITPQEIIRRFAAKEKEFKEAREHYTYRQTVKVQTLDGDTVDGEYQQVVDITFDDRGRRVENVIFAPQSTLRRVSMSQEDYHDIQNVLPFVLTSDEIGEYDILYVGRQQVDELTTYVLDVAPRTIFKGKRYFQGRIWVDDRDFQIVKTHGKPVPETRATKKNQQENLFPTFTTWREQVDGRYWFPTYTRADDVLHFANGDVRIREIVKYANYKRFGAQVKITYEGQELPPSEQKQREQQQPPKK